MRGGYQVAATALHLRKIFQWIFPERKSQNSSGWYRTVNFGIGTAFIRGSEISARDRRILVTKGMGYLASFCGHGRFGDVAMEGLGMWVWKVRE